MFQLKFSDKTPETRVKRLIKQKKNAEVIAILNDAIPAVCIQPSGTTTLHLAAKYDNLDLAKFLLESGVDVDVPDSSNSTPLMTAVLHNNYRLVEFLLANNASVCMTNDEDKSALKLALKTKAPRYAIKWFLDSLTSSELDSDSIAQVLTTNDFPLKYLSLLHDVEVMRSILDHQDAIHYDQSRDLVRRVMKSTSASNMLVLKTLLQHGPRRNARKRIFVEEFSHVLESVFPSKRYVTSLLRRLMSLDAVDEYFVRYLEVVFYQHRKTSIKLLLESEIDVHVLENTGQDLKVYLFGNPRVDAIEMIRYGSRAFDVDAKGRRGLRALHYAAQNKLGMNVRYLLDNGADPDGRDNLGITPLFYARDIESLEILLERGADVEAAKSDGLTILNSDRCDVNLIAVLSQVAVMEAKGREIQRDTLDSIDSCPRFKAFYDRCREQIEWMRTREIFRYGTLLDVVSKTAEELVPYVRDVKSGSKTMDFGFYKSQLHWYYYFTVKRRLKRAVKICKLRGRASRIVAESVVVLRGCDLVVEKIVGCLTYEDLMMFE